MGGLVCFMPLRRTPTPIEFCLRRAAPCRSIVTTPVILAKAFKPSYKLHSKLSQLCRRLAELSADK